MKEKLVKLKNYVAGENKGMSLDSVEKLFRKKREEYGGPELP